jgi:arginine deiminase
VGHSIGTDSEVGCLRTVLVHRPGAELSRITPKTRESLQFDGIPWISRAQQEHDALTEVLRERGTEVLYLTELLQDVLEYQSARDESIGSALAAAGLGDELGMAVGNYLEALAPEDLAAVLVAGLTPGEFRNGRGLVYEMLGPHDFIIEPLPNLVFSRDSSVWIGDQAVIASLPGPRRRETELLAAIYGHHPRFVGLRRPYRAGHEQLDGGDVLLLGPGVVAVGVGVRTTPASTERLAKHLLEAGVVQTVLAVPMNQRGQGGHLDRVCTVVDGGVVVMVPALAFTLTALTITARSGELRVSRPRPFLEAAAGAMGLDKLSVIDTGLDSLTSSFGQWDDGGNALALGQRVTVCSERNVATNARLATAGFEVVTVPAGELGGVRGGPRCLCTPITRDPATAGALGRSAAESGDQASAPLSDLPVIDDARVPELAGAAADPSRRAADLAPLP